MIKNKTTLEHKIGERLYQLVLDSDSPLGEVFDVLCHMKAFVVKKINESVQENVKNEEIVDGKVDSESPSEVQ